MPNSWRRSLRITRRTFGYGALVLLILAALLVSIANLFLPFIENNPQRVKQWLSEQVGQPVNFQNSHAEWTRRGPKISLQGLIVGEGNSKVSIDRAELLVSIYSGILPNHPLTELKVKALSLRLEQQPDDSWQLLGVPRQANSKADALDILSGFGELQVENSVLQINSKNKAPIRMPRVDMRLRVQGAKLTIGLRAIAKSGDLPVFVVANLDRETYSGKIWLGAPKLNLANWIDLVPQWNLPHLHAQTRADIWVSVQKRKIMRVHTKLDMQQVSFEKPLGKKLFSFGPPSALFDTIAFESYWQRSRNGWDFIIPEIIFDVKNSQQRITDIRVHAAHQSWQAQAASINLLPLATLNPAVSNYSPVVQRFLQETKLKGALSKLKAHGNFERKLWSVSGYANGLSISAIDKNPGFQNLAGAFTADQLGGSFVFRASDAQLDWPAAFGRNIPSIFTGNVLWWKSAADWVLAAKDVQWRADGMHVDVDMQLQMYADKRKPMLNVAARLGTFDFATAKRFWLQHIMPPASIQWLNMSLQQGKVRDASIIIAGDLAHWPFVDKAGRFSAQATIDAKQFKFAKDWPAAENALLYADFNGPGFNVVGNAYYMGNSLILKPSGMASFHETVLAVDISSATSMQALVPVINGTPLKQKLGEAVYSLRGEGPTNVLVNLLMPLNKGSEFNTINGSVDFVGTTIKAPLWKLAMQKATGHTTFTEKGFYSEGLLGLIDKNSVKLDLRVGQSYTQNKSNYFEALLHGNFSTDYLLNFEPSLKDLKGTLQGKSPWLFTISSPISKNQALAPVFLRAQSELVGTQINLPEPLQKSSITPQTLNLLTQLPVDKGLVEVKLGDQFRLLLKKPLNKPMSGISLFGRQTQGVIPAAGFSVIGQTERYDVAGWLAIANKAEEGAGLQSFDLSVNRLNLLGQEFGNTRLLMKPIPNGMSIRAQGANLDGLVIMPKAKNARINANFNTVHILPAEKKITSIETQHNAPIDFGNPAELPPISLVIQNLKIADADLGRCEIQTIPSTQGLLIQKFSTQSALMALNATGLWYGQKGQVRTSLQASLTSKDLGKLLTVFHYQDVIKSGDTKAQFTGAWAGSPMNFSMQSFNGNLHLDVGKGQLLGVEPGGGRVLGLISLAEVPRRLSFNFSDFFDKGFGFNQIKGQFTFSQGKASTQDLMILAPAADIKITGSTDLVKQEFNQRVEVRAKAGGLLPVIGAVTAGPIGAAAGVVAQAVFNKPLKDSAAIHYEITGPWAKPDVKKVNAKPKP